MAVFFSDVYSILKEPGLFLQLVSFPQSQPVKVLHRHTEHLDKLLWRQVALWKKRHNKTMCHYKSGKSLVPLTNPDNNAKKTELDWTILHFIQKLK